MDWLKKLFTPSRLPSAANEPSLLMLAMQSREVPAVRLVSDPTGQCQLGGSPVLPQGFVWPHWKGRPLDFLVSLDLPALQKVLSLEWLPKDGRLCFFYDPEQSTWGFDPADKGSWFVCHLIGGGTPTDAPAGTSQFPEIRLLPERCQSFPDPYGLRETSDLQGVEVSDDDLDEAIDFRELDGPRHQISGYPLPVQNDNMAEECQLASNGVYLGDPECYRSAEADALRAGSKDWKLLLQLDSDDTAGMMWGDLGRLYFWIREQDARAGDFSKVWMVLQCS